MVLGLPIVLASTAWLWLSACDRDAGAKLEAAAESTGTSPPTDATGQATTPEIAKAGSVRQDASSQVEVSPDGAGGASPSLTLSRLGSNKLTWNEVVKAGASYLVFERSGAADYDFTKPIQSLEDVVSLSLAEKPGTFCYIIRAKTQDKKIEVDSNEICITTSEGFINLTLSTEGQIFGEELITIKAAAASNQPGQAIYSIEQIRGPTMTLDTAARQWSFTSPNVRNPTEVSFEVTATLGSLARKKTIELKVMPKDHGPSLQNFVDQTVIATETLQVLSTASDPDQDTLSFACVLNCPQGFTIDAASGAISWQPQLNQLGEALPIIQVRANGQTASASLRILVVAPSLQINQGQLLAVSGEGVVLQPAIETNLMPPYQWSITQTSTPLLSMSGQDGRWSFTAPAVDERTTLMFDLKVGNGIFTSEHKLLVQIDPKPIAPIVDIGPDRLARAPIALNAVISSNAQTLSWQALSGPGQVTFSAATAASTSVTADTDGLYEIELAAVNSTGQVGKASFRLTWDTTAPRIEVGEDASTAQNLSRAASVQDAKSLNWTKVSGPGSLQFTPADKASTIIAADQDGEYVIQLTAEDEAGNISSDTFSWHYDHTAPSVTTGEPILMQSRSKILSATISDDAVAIQWKKLSGPLAVSFAPDNQRHTTVTLGGDGIYVLEVSASDALGNTATAQQQITIDTLPPEITEVSLGAVLADGYLNSIEKSKSLPLIASVAIADSSDHTLAYKVVSSTSGCSSSLTYAANVPLSDDATMSKTGSYKVCIKATDSMNLSAYAASSNFIYDTTIVTIKVSGLPLNPSRSTDLQALVSGLGVTHYKHKIGPAASTDCASIAGYSAETTIAAAMTDDYAANADGLLRLCAIGRTAAGHWQDLSLAFGYDWTLDRALPDDPAHLSVTPLVVRTRLSWNAVKHADSYLVIRAAGKIVTWLPTSGQTYAIGDDIDGGDHQVVGITSSLQTFDESAQGAINYHYALFAFDKALNYNINPARANTTVFEPLAFSKADGFDRLVRTLVPIHQGEHKGKILVGGDFQVYQQNPAMRLMRLNADYSLDTSFKPALINGSVYSIALADDGSIYIGGSFTKIGSKLRNRMARLSSSGELDEKFTPAGFNNTVMTLALSQDQARLYVGGSFTALTTIPANSMNRLAALRTVDGGLDGNFTLKYNTELARLGFNSTVWTILAEPFSSEIYVGGQFTDYGGVAIARLVKLDETGEIDSSLSLGSGFDNTVVTINIDQEQRLYVGGSFGRYRGSSYYSRLVRLKPNGTPDNDFSKGLATSPRFNNTVHAIEVDEMNQKVYVAGDFTLYGAAPLTRLARLSMTDGSLDTSLSTGTSGTLQALRLTESGKLIGAGNFQSYAGKSTAFFFAASGTDGKLDTESPRGSNLNNFVYATARVYDDVGQPTSYVKYFLAGSFTSFNGETSNRVVKLDRDGNRDKDFNSQVTNGNVYALAWDAVAQKLYVGGTFTQVNGVARNRLARLHADGSLDTTFVPAGFDSDVYAIALASLPVTGARVIYVGGKFTKSGSAVTPRLVRLGADGKTDMNFVTAGGFDNNVTALAVVPAADDHAIFVGGTFTKYNSAIANAPRLVKLSSDGSVAAGFEPGSGFNGSVQALLWQPAEGALYVGGAFSRYQGTIVANRIAKLDKTGGMAADFNATGFNSTVFALDYDAEHEHIWVGGAFTSFRGMAQGRIAAMGRDGSRVAAFNAPLGFNSDVRAITSSFWGVVAGGLGSSFEDNVCGFVARLHVNASMD